MKFSELTQARQKLDAFCKTGGIMGAVATAPVKALWSASKKTGGPFAPLLFGGAALGIGAAAKKGIAQAHNYGQGFNPQLQEAVARSY